MQNLFNRLFGNQPAPEPALSPAQQEIENLLDTAAMALDQGYYETALETYERGLTLARTLGATVSVEHFLSGIGAVHLTQDRFDAAHTAFDEALAAARETGDQRSLARSLTNFGAYYAKQQQWGVAQTYHQQALDAARETGEARVIARSLENLAQDYMQQDNPSYAQHLLKEAVIVTQAGGLLDIAPRILGQLADSTLAAGDRITGQRLLSQAVHVSQQTGQTDQQFIWLQKLAHIELENRNNAKAIEYLQTAENLALRLGDQPAEFFMNSALDLTTAYQRSGDSVQAEEYATRALAQARSTGNAAHEARALTRLGMAAYAMSDLPRALSFLTEALAYYDEHNPEQNDDRAQILLTLGNIAMRQGALDDAQRFTGDALERARTRENTKRQAEALHLLGKLALQADDRDTALERWNDALKLLGSGQYAQIAQLRCDIAGMRKENGDFGAALDEYEKALLLLNHIDHLPTRGLVLSNAATVYTEMGDVDTAQAFYDESIEIARSLGDATAESLRLGNLGWFFSLTGRPQSAIDRLEQALKLSRALDNTLMIAVQTNNLASTYYQIEDYQTARALHKQAVAAATATDADRWLAAFQSNMALTLVALDRLDEAEPLYRAAITTSERFGDQETLVRAQTRLALLDVRLGKLDEAFDLASQADARTHKMRYQRGIADAAAALGEIAAARGDESTAAAHFAEALRLYTILHDPAARRLSERVPQQA